MNNEQAKGNWDQLKGKVKQAYGKLSDNDISLLNGKRDEFFGKLEEAHGVARDQAEKQIREMEKSCGYCGDKSTKAA